MTQTLLVDYAWTHPNPGALKTAGYVGAVRYLSYDPSKNLTAAELAELHALGLGVAVVWEAGATDELGGAATGAAEGQKAAALAGALDWPAGRPIYYAADFPASGGQIDTAAAYLKAAAKTGPWPVGIYGSLATVDTLMAEGICAWGWQTSAWSGSAVSAHAQLYQRQYPTKAMPGVAAGVWDEDVALHPDWGGWFPAPPAPPPPPPHPVPIPAPAKPIVTVTIRDEAGHTAVWSG